MHQPVWPHAHTKPHARQVCFALCQLAAGFKVNAPTSLLSPYFKDIVQALLETVQPPSLRKVCTHVAQDRACMDRYSYFLAYHACQACCSCLGLCHNAGA